MEAHYIIFCTFENSHKTLKKNNYPILTIKFLDIKPREIPAQDLYIWLITAAWFAVAAGGVGHNLPVRRWGNA